MTEMDDRWRRKCPVCERPVGQGSIVCPYCDEPLPHAVRDRIRFHLPFVVFAAFSVPHAVWGGDALSVLPFAAFLLAKALGRRDGGIWRIAVALVCAVAAVAALDPVLRHDAVLLWRRHGPNLGLSLLLAYAFLRHPVAEGVSSDIPGDRLRERLLPAVVDAALLGIGALCLLL